MLTHTLDNELARNLCCVESGFQQTSVIGLMCAQNSVGRSCQL